MEKSVALLGKLLNESPEALQSKIETDEGLQEIEGKISKLTVMDTETFKARELDLEHVIKDRLKEDARKGKLDTEIYNVVANNIISKQDKELASEFGIEDFKSHDDLVSAIKATKGTDDNLKSDYEKLRQRNAELVDELKSKDSEIEKKINEYNTKSFKQNLIENYPYDYEDEDQLKARKWNAESIVNGRYELGMFEGKQVLLDEEGKPLRNPDTHALIDPKEHIYADLKKVVPFKKDAEPGSPARKQPETQPTKMSKAQFDEKMEKDGVQPMSDAYYAELDKMKKSNLIE